MKSENCLSTLHHINQSLPLSLKNLLTNENDLHNYSTRSSVNNQLALPQLKTINYGLHSIRYRTAKHWNSVQNTVNLNVANNFISSRKFLKAFKKNIYSDNSTIVWSFQRYSINLIVCFLVFPKQESWKFWNIILYYLPLLSDRLFKTKIKTHKSRHKYHNYSSL